MSATHTEDEVKIKVAEALSGLRPDQRERVLNRVKAQVDQRAYEQGQQELADVRQKLGVERQLLAKTKEQIHAIEGLHDWTLLKNYKLEKNDCSRLHKLQEAIQTGKLMNEDGTLLDGKRAPNTVICASAQPFVVQHDWAAAFASATDYIDGEFNLPYMHCAFEFRISGRTVIVIAFQPDAEVVALAPEIAAGPHLAFPYVECTDGYWFFGGKAAREDPIMQFAWLQVRAISVALDAEVAEREITRAPTKLNERRLKDGKIPLYDYNVVKLRGRQKHHHLGGGGTHRSPRLHFRRGHWRHFESHKTWIRWMLVGDPSLGFIDKAYRL